ncbi:MAG: hypothetical protein HYZ29_00840 [Myxococcales bacterium]|nr:hypothetical protein [Myxococcales bacterium]
MMSNQDQITRLQGLLDRVKKNATRPRGAVVATTSPATSPAPPPEPEEEELVAMDEAEVSLPEPALVEAEAPEETSMVRAIADADVSVEMGEASIEDLDLLEDEIVDITEAEVEPPEAEAEAEEEPPASSRRAIAGSMGEALAEAAGSAGTDEGREIPLKTPPPESGPQAAPLPQGLMAPAVPELRDLHEADIVSRTQPTAAQLGATVELEPASEAELELGEPEIEAPPVHAVREEAPVRALAPEPVEPEVVRRPAVATAPAGAFVSAAKSFHPQSFLELLDASLGLGRD